MGAAITVSKMDVMESSTTKKKGIRGDQRIVRLKIVD